jgi:hypothetical protein
MPLIRLVARRPCSFQGRDLLPGESFDASPIEAVVLVTAKKATFATRQDVSPRTAAPARKKRTYTRRDLRAEP